MGFEGFPLFATKDDRVNHDARVDFDVVKRIGDGLFFFPRQLVFIDENSFVQNIRYDRQISQLRKSVNHYQQIVDESRARLDELRSDDENLEKFARETYQMKRDNEDVFVFVDD